MFKPGEWVKFTEKAGQLIGLSVLQDYLRSPTLQVKSVRKDSSGGNIITVYHPTQREECWPFHSAYFTSVKEHKRNLPSWF